MIIDSHVHLKHGDAAGTEYPLADILSAMDAANIGKAVVFAMSTTTRRSIEMAESACAQHPDRFIRYVYALPDYERAVASEIEFALSKRQFKGIKIHQGECTLADHVIGPVLKLAAKYHAPCLVDFCGNAAVAERLAAHFPDTPIIAAHIGRYLSTDEQLMDRFIQIAAEHPNVYIDVSGVVRLWKIRDAVRRIGSKRVIWGTDGPYAIPDTATYARMELDKMKLVGLSDEELTDVLGRSIAELLRIGA